MTFYYQESVFFVPHTQRNSS